MWFNKFFIIMSTNRFGGILKPFMLSLFALLLLVAVPLTYAQTTHQFTLSVFGSIWQGIANFFSSLFGSSSSTPSTTVTSVSTVPVVHSTNTTTLSTQTTSATTTVSNCYASVNIGSYGSGSTGASCSGFSVNIGSYGVYSNYGSACPSQVNIGSYGRYYNNVTGCSPIVNVGSGASYYNINSNPTTTQYTTTVPTTTIPQPLKMYCYSSSGYSCTNLVYSHSAFNSTAYLTATISQNTGTAWGDAILAYVPAGTKLVNGIPSSAFAYGNYRNITATGDLNSGQNIYATLSSAGNLTNGSIWACYTIANSAYQIDILLNQSGGCVASSGQVYYTEIAMVSTSSGGPTTTTIQQYSSYCLAASGYRCLNPVLYAYTGNLNVTLGQSTGTNWTNVGFVFVPQGTATQNGIPVTFNSSSIQYYTYISSGNTYYFNLPVTYAGVARGTSITGTVWAKYHLYGSTAYYTQLASAQLTAT